MFLAKYIFHCILNYVLHKKGDDLHLSFHFVMQHNAPLVSTIITVVLLCHFIFVTAPNPVTVIIALSTNSAILNNASLFCFGINIHFLFFFGEGVTNCGSGIFFWTFLFSNIISPDCRDEQYLCVLPRCQFSFNNTFTSHCV